jgi:hypothetical protein
VDRADGFYPSGRRFESFHQDTEQQKGNTVHVLKVYCDVHPRHLVAKIYPRERWVWEITHHEGGWWDMPFNTAETLDLPAPFDSPALTRKYSVGCQKCRGTAFVQVNGNQLRDIVWPAATRGDFNTLKVSQLGAILTK